MQRGGQASACGILTLRLACLHGERAFDGCGLDPRLLHQQIRDKRRIVRLRRVVGHVRNLISAAECVGHPHRDGESFDPRMAATPADRRPVFAVALERRVCGGDAPRLDRATRPPRPICGCHHPEDAGGHGR